MTNPKPENVSKYSYAFTLLFLFPILMMVFFFIYLGFFFKVITSFHAYAYAILITAIFFLAAIFIKKNYEKLFYAPKQEKKDAEKSPKQKQAVSEKSPEKEKQKK